MIRAALFEPWAFGDAIIAASFLPHVDEEIGLVCDARWIRTIRGALPNVEEWRILGVHLDYTHRDSLESQYFTETVDLFPKISKVYSIRGDFRDYFAAKKIFSNPKIKMVGWLQFFAWHFRILDLPFSWGLLRVKNRYSLWSQLLSVPLSNPATARLQRGNNIEHPMIVIHIGAQWNSKRYPFVRKLQKFLLSEAYRVSLIAGPKDKILDDFVDPNLIQVQDEELIDRIRSADLFLTNDSGPMHLAALLGVNTLVIARASNIHAWKAPNVHTIYSEWMPKGYSPDRGYDSDKILNGWPSPEDLMMKIRTLFQN